MLNNIQWLADRESSSKNGRVSFLWFSSSIRSILLGYPPLSRFANIIYKIIQIQSIQNAFINFYKAAFKTKKYNLAMNLIERVKTKDDLVVMEKVNSVWSVSSKNLAHLLAKHSFECASDASVVSVSVHKRVFFNLLLLWVCFTGSIRYCQKDNNYCINQQKNKIILPWQ